MRNLQNIKKNLKGAVNELPSDKKAELYSEDRKRYIKLGMEGKQKKAMELLKRNDEFYKEYSGEDPNVFHQAHHKFMNWSHDYTYFQFFQFMIATADREKDIHEFHLEIVETLKSLLNNYQQFQEKEFLDYALRLVEAFNERLSKDLTEYNNEIIPGIKQKVMDNEYFKEHDYFKDVDPLGFKNITWDEYYAQKCKLLSIDIPKLEEKEVKNHD